MRRGLLTALCLLGALAGVPERGTAAAPAPLVGISDQHAAALTDPRLRALRPKVSRLVVPWDVALAGDTGPVQHWLAAARDAGIAPLIAFGRRADDACPGRDCRPPTSDAYRAAVRAFVARFPDVREYVPWNEPNHPDQPTAGRPGLVAEFHEALQAACPRCTVVAGDLLDSEDLQHWTRILAAEISPAPRVWGLHDYRAVNRFSTASAELFLRLVPGEVWLTETGGIVLLQQPGGIVVQPYDEQRAADAVDLALTVAHRHRDRIRRVYLYSWSAPAGFSTFDSGFVRADGSERPALEVLRRWVRSAAAHVPPGADDAVDARPGAAGGRSQGRSPAAPRGLPRIRIAGTRLPADRRRVTLRLSCFGAPRCDTRVRIVAAPRGSAGRGGLTLARRTVAVTGVLQAQRFVLTARGRRWLRRSRSARRRRPVVAVAGPAPGRLAVEPTAVDLTVTDGRKARR